MVINNAMRKVLIQGLGHYSVAREALIRRWSRYLIFFILLVLPLERIPSLEVGGATVRLSQVAALLLIAINLPALFERRAQLLQAPWRWIWLFLLIMGVSALFALDPARSVVVTAFTGFVVVVAWTISVRFEPDQLGNYVRVLFVGALATCAFGFYQFFGDLAGVPNYLTGLRDAYTKKVFGFPRIQSTALEPLYFADYLLLPICLGAALFLFRRSVYLWSLVPMLVCLWLTVSRGAFAAMAVVLLLLVVYGVVLGRAKRAGALLGVVLVTVGISVGMIALGSTIDAGPAEETGTETRPAKGAGTGAGAGTGQPGADTDVSSFSRQATSVAQGERGLTRDLGLQAFSQRPLLGVGPGNFGGYARGVLPEIFYDDSAIVNNEPVEILAETGVLGLLFFGLFTLSLLWLTIRTLTRGGVREQPWTLALLVCLVGYAAQYQFFSTLYVTHVWVTIGLLLGSLAAGTVSQTSQPISQDKRPV